MDAIYARKRRRREKQEEEELKTSALKLSKANLALRVEEKRLSQLLEESKQKVASLPPSFTQSAAPALGVTSPGLLPMAAAVQRPLPPQAQLTAASPAAGLAAILHQRAQSMEQDLLARLMARRGALQPAAPSQDLSSLARALGSQQHSAAVGGISQLHAALLRSVRQTEAPSESHAAAKAALAQSILQHTAAARSSVEDASMEDLLGELLKRVPAANTNMHPQAPVMREMNNPLLFKLMSQPPSDAAGHDAGSSLAPIVREMLAAAQQRSSNSREEEISSILATLLKERRSS